MAKSVNYRILLKHKGKHYKLATIVINEEEGDVLYAPSQRGLINKKSGVMEKILDHVSFHSSGRLHLKMKDGEPHIVEEGQGFKNPVGEQVRQIIQDIGFQEMIRDTVKNVTSLPEHKKTIEDIDVVLDIEKYDGSVQFIFSVVSGREIVRAHQGKPTPVKQVSVATLERKIAGQIRALGHKSGNADKMLQYTLWKYTGTPLESERGIYLAPNSGIKRH